MKRVIHKQRMHERVPVAKSATRAWTQHIIFFVILITASFVAGRVLVFAQVWSPPINTPPVNNTGQPPTVSNPTGFLRKSPIATQTLKGLVTGAKVSSVPVELANPTGQAGRNNSIIARKSFSSVPSSRFPSGTSGIFGYATGTDYGLYAAAEGSGLNYALQGKADTAGYAGRFQGPVTIAANGPAVGSLRVEGLLTTERGISCIEQTGQPGSCLGTPENVSYRATNYAGGYGLWSYSTNLPGVSLPGIEINLSAIPGYAAYGIGQYGIGGMGTTGVHGIAQGSDDTDTYRGVYGVMSQGVLTTFYEDGRKGVYGVTNGGLGNNPPGYSSGSQYDFAAGVRACVKDSTGAILNRNGIYGTGGKYAGYFNGDSGVDNKDDGTVMIAGDGPPVGSGVFDPNFDGTPGLVSPLLLLPYDSNYPGNGFIKHMPDPEDTTWGGWADSSAGFISDANYLYTANVSMNEMYIEKRRKTDGMLCYASGICGADAFGGYGIGLIKDVQMRSVYQLVHDGTYLYARGCNGTCDSGTPNFRISKYLMTNGDQCNHNSCPAGNFGNQGYVGDDYFDAMAVSSGGNYMFTAGNVGTPISEWRIEKRFKNSSDLDTSFNGTGIYSIPISGYMITGIFIDSTYFYVIGRNDVSGQSLIQKRLITNGALDATFDGDSGDTSYPGNGQIDFLGIITTVSNDGTYMYLGGFVNPQGIVHKRKLSDGSHETGFGSNGVITLATKFNPIVIKVYGSLLALIDRCDEGFPYPNCGGASGHTIEMRSSVTGDLDLNFDGNPGDKIYPANGMIRDGTTASASMWAIEFDANYIYLVGGTSRGGWMKPWLFEKRTTSSSSVGAALRIGTTYLTKRNLRGLMCKYYLSNGNSPANFANCCVSSGQCPTPP